MDLKKLFVYVPSVSEDTFIANVINKPDEAAKYANKIVFLEKTLRIWAKGQYYGSNPADVAAVWTALGIKAGTVPSGNYTVGESSYSYTGFNQKFDAFKQYTDAKIAAEKAEVVTAYQKADTDLNNAYTAFKNKVGDIDELTGTLLSYITKHDASARTEVKVSGSGLDIQKTQGANGNDIYTITADQSIWEFCGTYECPDTTHVDAGLNAQYGTEGGAKRLHAEVGDVWAVTLTNTKTTVLYACSEHTDGDPDTNVWVAIGAAQGIVDVDISEHNGVALTKNGGIVGVSVTPGTITENDGSVITGGTAYTAIKAAQDNAYAYTSSVGEAIINGYLGEINRVETSFDKKISEAVELAYQVDSKAEAAYSYANTRANEAQANAYAKIESTINALDAAYSGTLTASYNGTNYTYLSYNVAQTDGALNTAYITMDVNAIQNYVLDTMWETYSAYSA